jgi:hypothetical protein
MIFYPGVVFRNPMLKSFIMAGACDCFVSGFARPQLFWQLRRFFRAAVPLNRFHS